jgi:two-component system nitrogen regulation response regulator GlnG
MILSGTEATVDVARRALEPLSYKVAPYARLKTCLKHMAGTEIVLMDVPNLVRTIAELKAYCPEAVVLAVTGGNGANAQALESGAFQCLGSPLDQRELQASVRTASAAKAVKAELERLKPSATVLPLGSGEAMTRVIGQIKRASARSTPVLVMGEHGTGKSLVARSIHDSGARWFQPFIVLDAADEGFGAALLGSPEERSALLRAEGGSVFVMNACRMDQSLEPAFARFCREGVIETSTGEAVRVEARLIAGVEAPAPGEAFKPLFRTVIKMPPLSERTEDILPLAAQFLNEAVRDFGLTPKTISPDAAKVLLARSWPGNVSELKATVRRASVLVKNGALDPIHITLDDGTTHCSIKEFLDAKLSRYIRDKIKQEHASIHGAVITEVEKALIELVMDATGGNKLRTAAVLGITRTTLRSKLKTFGLGSRPKGGPGRSPRASLG